MDISSNASNGLSATREKDTVHVKTHALPSEWNLRDLRPKDGKPWYATTFITSQPWNDHSIPLFDNQRLRWFILHTEGHKHDFMKNILQFL